MLDQQFILGKAYKVRFKSLFERHGVCTTAGLTCLHKGGGVFRLEQIATFRDVVLAGVKLYDNFFAPVGITEEEYHQYFNGKPEDEYTAEYATVDVATESTTPSTTVVNGETVLTPTTVVKTHEVFKETGNSILKKHFADNVSYAEYPIYKFVDVLDAEDAIYAPELTIDGFPDIDIAEYKNLNLVLHLGYFDDPSQLDPMLLSIRDRMALYGLKAKNIKLYSSGSKWLTPVEYEDIKSLRKPADLVTIGNETYKSPDDHLYEHVVTDGGLKQIVSTVSDSDNEIALSDLTKKQVVLDNQLFITEVKPNEVFDSTSIYYISVDGTSEHMRLMEPTACIPGNEVISFNLTADTTPFVAKDASGNVLLKSNGKPRYKKRYYKCTNNGMKKVPNDAPREYQEGTYYVKGYTKVYRQVPGGSAIISGAKYYKKSSTDTEFVYVDSSTWDGAVPYTTDVTYYRLDITYPSTATYRLATKEEIADSSGITELYLKYNFLYEEVTDIPDTANPCTLGYYEADHVYFKESYVTNAALAFIGRQFDYLDEYHYPKTMQLLMTDLIDTADVQTSVTLPGTTSTTTYTEVTTTPVPVDSAVVETKYRLVEQSTTVTYNRKNYRPVTKTKTYTETVTGYDTVEHDATLSNVRIPTVADREVTWLQDPGSIITLSLDINIQNKWKALINSIYQHTFLTGGWKQFAAGDLTEEQRAALPDAYDMSQKMSIGDKTFIAVTYENLFDMADAFWDLPENIADRGSARANMKYYNSVAGTYDWAINARNSYDGGAARVCDWIGETTSEKEYIKGLAKDWWLHVDRDGCRQYCVVLFGLPSELKNASFSASDISVRYFSNLEKSARLLIDYNILRALGFGTYSIGYVEYMRRIGKWTPISTSEQLAAQHWDTLSITDSNSSIYNYTTGSYDNSLYHAICTSDYAGPNKLDETDNLFYTRWYSNNQLKNTFSLVINYNGEEYACRWWYPLARAYNPDTQSDPTNVRTSYNNLTVNGYFNSDVFPTHSSVSSAVETNASAFFNPTVNKPKLNGYEVKVRETADEETTYSTISRERLLSTTYFGNPNLPPAGCPVAIDYVAALITADNKENVLQLWGVPREDGTFSEEYATQSLQSYRITIPDDSTMRTVMEYRSDQNFYNMAQLYCRLTAAERTRLLSTYTENQQLHIKRACGLADIQVEIPNVELVPVQKTDSYSVEYQGVEEYQEEVTSDPFTINVKEAYQETVYRPAGAYRLDTVTRQIPIGSAVSGDYDRYYGRKFRYVGAALTTAEIEEGKLTNTYDVVLSADTIGLVAGKTGVLLGRVGQLSKPTYIYDPDQEKRNYFIRYKLESQDNQFLRGKLADYERVLEQQFAPTIQGT